MKNGIKTLTIRSSQTLEALENQRIKAIHAEIGEGSQLSIELALLDEQEYDNLKDYQQSLSLPPEEIKDFLASPPNPEMASILNTGRGSDRLSKLNAWQNRLKRKINTPIVKNLWQLGLPVIGYGIAVEAGVLFTQGNHVQAGATMAAGLGIVLFDKITEKIGQEAVADLTEPREVLPSVKFLLTDESLSATQREAIKNNLANLKPEEATLLAGLKWGKLKSFLSGNLAQQRKILETHKFSSTSWMKTINQMIATHNTLENQLKLDGQTIINNLMVRRQERRELEQRSKTKLAI